MNEHLERARTLLAIAESADSKLEAYRAASEELAAYKAETGSSNRDIAISLWGSEAKEQTIQKLLRWREKDFPGDSPYTVGGEDGSRQTRSHAKRALRDPEQRKQVIQSLSVEERAGVLTDLVKDGEDEVLDAVLEDERVREAIVDEEEKRFQERRDRAKAASDASRQPTPLGQFFWRLVGRLKEWTRDLKFVEAEAHGLQPGQRPAVVQDLTVLRDQCQACIDAIEGKADDDDVIEARVSGPELTA